MSLPICPNCQSDLTYQQDELFICPICFYEWTSSTVHQEVVKDVNGNELNDGDSVTVIKDLKIKGAPVLKQNTVIKNIVLRPGESENVSCRLSTHGTLFIKSEFLKKGLIMKIIKGDLSLLPKELEPTLIIGKMDLTYFNGKWSYKEELIKESYYKEYEPLDVDYIKRDSEIFLVYENKLVVGFLIIWKDWNNYGWIDEIRVLREYQNKGYGKALILEAEKWAKSKGLIGLALESQDNNLIAARFYQKQGFVIGGINNQLYQSFKKDEIAVFWYKVFK